MANTADVFQLPFGPATFGNRFGVHDVEGGHDLYGPQGHRGTDFVVPAGTGVPAVANGIVSHVLWSNALGNVVVVEHHRAGGIVYSGYCHLSSVSVREGQTVRLGQIIAHSGNTGTATTGPHLHLTMSTDDMGVEYGEVFDPIPYIENRTVPGTTKPAAMAFTTARRGEGLWTIAQRSGITLAAIEKLNPKITPPNYLVLLGQSVRIK